MPVCALPPSCEYRCSRRIGPWSRSLALSPVTPLAFPIPRIQAGATSLLNLTPAEPNRQLDTCHRPRRPGHSALHRHSGAHRAAMGGEHDVASQVRSEHLQHLTLSPDRVVSKTLQTPRSYLCADFSVHSQRVTSFLFTKSTKPRRTPSQHSGLTQFRALDRSELFPIKSNMPSSAVDFSFLTFLVFFLSCYHRPTPCLTLGCHLGFQASRPGSGVFLL